MCKEYVMMMVPRTRRTRDRGFLPSLDCIIAATRYSLPAPSCRTFLRARGRDVQGEDRGGGAEPGGQDHDRQLPVGRHGERGRGVPAHSGGQDTRVRDAEHPRQQQGPQQPQQHGC